MCVLGRKKKIMLCYMRRQTGMLKVLLMVILSAGCLYSLNLWYKKEHLRSVASSFQPNISPKSPETNDLIRTPAVGGDRGVLTDDEGLLDTASAIAKKHGVVLFSVINDAFLPLAASWLCNTAPLDRVHSKVLFLTTDVNTGQRLQRQWPQISVAVVNSSTFSGDMKYSTAGYVRLMVQRTRYIQRLVQARIPLLLFEVDFVWLADPLPVVQSYSADIIGIHVHGTKDNKVCGCFLLLNSTAATVKVWSRLTQMMEELYQTIRSKGAGAGVSEGTNDQTYLSQLLRENYSGAKHIFLPENLFPEGVWYKKPQLRLAQPNPLIIHNNWIIGNDNKISRAKKFGHWFLTDTSTPSNFTCNVTAVQNIVRLRKST